MIKYDIVEVKQLQNDGSYKFIEFAFSEDQENYYGFNGEYIFNITDDVADLDQDIHIGSNDELITTRITLSEEFSSMAKHIVIYIYENLREETDIHKIFKLLKDTFEDYLVEIKVRTNYEY